MKKLTAISGLIAALLILCSPLKAQEQIAGHTFYNNDESVPMPGSYVYLINQAGDTVSDCITDVNGAFTMPFPDPGTYLLTTSTNINPGGIDFEDSFLIMLHLFGLHNFTDIEAVAADVNGSGNITWGDYWTIVIGWFVNGYPFPAGEWGYSEISFIIGAKEDPPAGGGNNGGGGDDPPEFDDIDLGMISIGDCSGGYNPVLLKESNSISVIQSEVNCSGNQFVEIPVTVNDPMAITGMALAFNYDNSLMRIVDVTSEYKINYAVSDKQLRISWIDEEANAHMLSPNSEIIKIRLKTLPGFSSGSVADLKNTSESHFIDANGIRIPYAQLKSAKLISNGSSELVSELYPNPAGNYTFMDVSPKLESPIIINFYDISGKLVQQFSETPQSASVMQINLEQLPAGTYFYTVTVNDMQVNRKQFIKK
jgi:hypothetical protein